MRHLGCDVNRSRESFQCVQVLWKTLPLPINTLGKRCSGDIFYTLHEFNQKVSIVWFDGCEPNAAIPHHHGGDAVPAGRCQNRIPSGLAIIVSVDIHPARSNQLTVGIDFIVRAFKHLTYFHDLALRNRDISYFSISASPIDDGSVSYDEVVHRVSLLFSEPLQTERCPASNNFS